MRRLCVIFGLLLLAGTAAAQPGRGGGQRGKLERIRQHISTMRAHRLTEALQLDEPTAGRLFALLGQYDDQFAQLLRQGGELRRELRAELSGGGADDAKVNRLIDGLLGNQRAMWKLQDDRFAAVRRVLTPAQAAKALIVLNEIDRAIGKQIRRAMKRGRRGPPNPP
jgi:Spy/CpxP family protein refolding chaperone